jgi:hypothetical protein
MSFTTIPTLGMLLVGWVPPSINEDFTVTTSGQNIVWECPSLIDTDGSFYEMLYTVLSANVIVSYAGFEFGPYDVTDMIPPEVIVTWQPSAAPMPLDFMWHEVITPDDGSPPTLAYEWIVEVDAGGNIQWRGKNVILGEAVYDLGWPFGEVTVQIEEGTINSNIEIYQVENPCYEDVNANGSVDVSDLLAVIDNWGLCPDCLDEIPGDVNFDSVVDVTDLLLIVGSWGPCPI